jgi:hypothetical protein
MRDTRWPNGTMADDLLTYRRWLQNADVAIERGLNANAIWRLHEEYARFNYDVADQAYVDLGGES